MKMKMKHLKIGDSAPTFKVKNQSDRMVELNQFKGKKLLWESLHLHCVKERPREVESYRLRS